MSVASFSVVAASMMLWSASVMADGASAAAPPLKLHPVLPKAGGGQAGVVTDIYAAARIQAIAAGQAQGQAQPPPVGAPTPAVLLGMPPVPVGAPLVPASLAPASGVSVAPAASLSGAQPLPPVQAVTASPGPLKAYATLEQAATDGVDPLREKKPVIAQSAPKPSVPVVSVFEWRNPAVYLGWIQVNQERALQYAAGLVLGIAALLLVSRLAKWK